MTLFDSVTGMKMLIPPAKGFVLFTCPRIGETDLEVLSSVERNINQNYYVTIKHNSTNMIY